MFSCGFIPQRRMLVAVIILCSVCTDALAAFGGLVPLSWTGQLAYNYGYMENAGNESETTSLLLGLDASGYIWRPWFATTSLALNLGLSNSVTATSSSDSTVGTGDFSLGIFPGSRFPFSMNYSRTDSRSQSFQDISRTSGDTSFTVTRLSLRQSYRPRGYGQVYNAWYYLTKYSGEAFDSESTTYGLDYSLRFSPHSLALNATHSSSTSSSNTNEPSTDVLSLTHVYTPSNELGVNNLVSVVQTDPGDGGAVSKDSQAFSSFFWRPEHRAVNVSGGVRLSETQSEGVVTTVSRGLNTHLGLGYRITRSLNFSANASVGTTDSNDTQTLSTAEAASLSYSGGRHQISDFSYSWQWNGGVSNSNTRIEAAGTTASADQQSISSGIGHNLGKSWALSQNSSVSGNFSQSVSGSKSSEQDVVAKTLNHSLSLSWNRRGQRGSTYLSSRLSDSRGYGERDTVYDDFGASLISDYAINRLSSLSGNVDFSASQNETENDAGGKDTSGSSVISGGLGYRNSRPLGIYNLQFSSNLAGSKQLDSSVPTTTLRWDASFRYSLGLLSTTLNFRASRSPSGVVSKSMNFQATRSF
jgi:hypothetical protein